ncbi:MAG TPA: 1,4-dihydroxy-6-naphthoate synthase [Flavisolibacter sp.]|jgi:1,4-dihydroxy-6-naphthoate synthase|nr:1,4-dihydroxy-6-naphthoate synthase [Flavisolibacter sp.]
MKLTLGFSPCPNDTFIFDALINKKIDTEGLEFDAVLEDVQTLNAWAAEEKLAISKLSFPALFAQIKNYSILNTGAALGKGVGPLLIANKMVNVPDIAHCKIAVPGENTTANFLLHYAFPQSKNIAFMLFSSIEEAVLSGEADLGVIIHENRFTYQQRGLHKICDLGEVWESREGMPVPLGCIAIKKNLPVDIATKVDGLIKKSLHYAFKSYPALSSYITQHAQEMEEEVMRKHIELYVNNYSIELGIEGKNAIQKLYSVYRQLQGTDHPNPDELFIHQ